jgi:hypothetical protein
MLYNSKWDAKVKQNIYALPTLIAWLETMPADRTYNFTDCLGGTCLFGQYLEAHEVAWSRGATYVKLIGTELEAIAAEKPWTFGAALVRARELVE